MKGFMQKSDKEGNLIDGGIFTEDAQMSLEMMKDDEQIKTPFKGQGR